MYAARLMITHFWLSTRKTVIIVIYDAHVSNEMQLRIVLVKLPSTDGLQFSPNLHLCKQFLYQRGFQNRFKIVSYHRRNTVLFVKHRNFKISLEHLLCVSQAEAVYYSKSFCLPFTIATFYLALVTSLVTDGVFAQEENRLLSNWIAYGLPVPFRSQDSSI